MLALAVWGILEPHGWRRSVAAGAVVARVHPQPGRARLASARAEHRHGRVIGVNLARPQDVAAHGVRQRLEQPRRAGYPVRQRGALDHHALAGVDLALAVQRQVVAELAHQHLRDDASAAQAALDGAARRGRLQDRVAACAGEPGAHMAHDLEAAGLVLQHFRGVLANLAQCGAAPGAGALWRWEVYHLLARQVPGQLPGGGAAGSRLALLAGVLKVGDRGAALQGVTGATRWYECNARRL